ncbi:iron ABC transporter substrate-binding protein [Clostridium botulinum A2B7 92]|uniref:Iron ABC transporter substrate-binding protein n=1 Tax=Clostridium botulinum TaxID=1491 RepID=A0A846J1H9_CLOBO|nr:ABC transporter substrate-binding protein [Clostridium botulinum]ACA57203.1 putative iron ABC transporter, iron-binding protein [Clostridium botulinum A3 str. Loch Maree]KEJ00085.1 iron ABC transporter substrate-binding protein [Clostridium botulinum A2B7 92]NFH64250.1 iron ABC transporter substrate-binding protein [Clostridium botulinum]NFJ07171.1 iron ABC transporter substrate-binding protein [Clostridium botulinum]NFK14143.1 iron ABC transporter substrate-binding protein [Clostridium bot
MKGKGIRKLYKKLILGAITASMVISLSACSQNNTAKDKQNKDKVETSSQKGDKQSYYPVTVTNYNYAGEKIKVTFDKVPEKVLSTNQTTTELMLDLGLEKHLVGTCYLDNPILDRLKDKYKKVSVVSEKYPTKEQVLSLQPDLILGWKSVFADKTLGDIKEWNERKVNTFVQRNTVKTVGNFTVENTFKDIDDLGTIFNAKDKTDKYVKDLKDRLSKIEEKTSKLNKKKKVLILESENKDSFRVYGKNDLVGDMVLKAGGENLGEKSGSMSLENIVSANPDAIILVHFGDDKKANDKDVAKILTENKALANVNAVKNKQIVITGLAETWAGGVRTVDAVEHYAKELYPELFK